MINIQDINRLVAAARAVVDCPKYETVSCGVTILNISCAQERLKELIDAIKRVESEIEYEKTN